MTRHYLVRYDQTGTAALREEMRGEHIAYRKGLGDALLLAGPILGGDDKPAGSVIIIAAEDQHDAARIVDGDPFVQAGLLTVMTIEPMRIAAMKLPSQ